jgi:hypothetical protein
MSGTDKYGGHHPVTVIEAVNMADKPAISATERSKFPLIRQMPSASTIGANNEEMYRMNRRLCVDIKGPPINAPKNKKTMARIMKTILSSEVSRTL